MDEVKGLTMCREYSGDVSTPFNMAEKEIIKQTLKKYVNKMKKYVRFVSLLPGMALAVCLLLAACRPAYEVTKVEGRLVAMDSTWDARPDSAAVALLLPYVNRVDSAMRHVLGQAAVSMEAGRPESLLSNLIADVLREAAAKTLGRPADMGLVNMGGLRSSLTRGDITLENVYEILPFENTLCVMTLKGRVLRQLFENIAVRRGEGVSGVKLVVSKGTYTVATLDYLAEGNDGMYALRQAESSVCPPNATLRSLFIDYVERQAKQGKAVTARMEGRIVLTGGTSK